MDSPHLLRIAGLVQAGLLPPGPSNECLQSWQAQRKAGRDVSLLDLFVRAKLLTATQAAVLDRETLTRRQPFRDYRLLRQAGEGGMAIVFEAAYVPFKVRVALKVLDTPFCLREAYRLRFRREAQILLALDHPNIVAGREHRTEDGVDFYAMAFVDGISILDLIEDGGALDERFCLHVALQTAEALDHMHGRGIVHRDVKPANLVVDPSGHVRIIDFGFAKVMAGMRQDTSEETTVGTPEYMSPEQAQGRQEVDGRADLYSLGASLFHMLTGELPFRGDQAAVMYGHVKVPVSFSPAQRARISAPLQYVVQRAMAKAPEHRYPTGRAFVEEVESLCAPTLARPLVVPERVRDSAVESAPIDPRGRGQPPRLAPRPGQSRTGRFRTRRHRR